jgi:hypothetical protein
MKTCTNISAKTWPATAVVKATRRSGFGQGHMFHSGLSIWYRGRKHEVNPNRLEASR